VWLNVCEEEDRELEKEREWHLNPTRMPGDGKFLTQVSTLNAAQQKVN